MTTISKLFLLCFSVFSFPMLAQQANLVVFSHEGDHFYLMINGIHQNTEARTNVKVVNMPAETAYNLKIIFADNSMAPISKNFYPSEGGMESAFTLKRNKKGEMKARAFGYNEIKTNEAAPNQYVVVYGSPQEEVVEATVEVAPEVTTNTTVNNNTTTTTTTTTTNTNQNTNTNNNSNASVNMNTNITDNGNGGSVGTTISDGETTVSMNMSVSENGISVDINENSTNATGQPVTTENTTTNSTYSETTTTTTNTTTVNGQVVDHNSNTTTTINDNNNGQVNSTVTVTEETVNSTTTTHNNQFTTNPATGCLTSADYKALVTAVKAEDFEDDKMNVAKEMTPDCLDVNQIKGVMQLFDFEDDRLEYAKYTFTRCSNQADFHEVFDLFDFQDNVKALNRYMQEHK